MPKQCIYVLNNGVVNKQKISTKNGAEINTSKYSQIYWNPTQMEDPFSG
jgi:DNA-directed RNA polymerase subunit E'/Rpb7